MWREIFPGSNFCDFSSDLQNYVPANKIYRKYFPAKIYSRVNILLRKFATEKYCAVK